jgi:hypothetical protein
MRAAMKLKLLAAVILLTVSAPSFAADQDVRHHRHHAARGTDEIYLHNYGPPDFYPGTNIQPTGWLTRRTVGPMESTTDSVDIAGSRRQTTEAKTVSAIRAFNAIARCGGVGPGLS